MFLEGLVIISNSAYSVQAIKKPFLLTDIVSLFLNTYVYLID